MTTSEARKRHEENFVHRHNWTISLSKVGPDMVFCNCGSKFTPDNQQFTYMGTVPRKFL
jgi:hypothetical protein